MVKPTIKLIALGMALFALIFIGAFFFLFSIFNLLYTLNIISVEILLIGSLVVAAIIALIVVLCVMNSRKSKLSKFRLFISEKFFGIILFFLVLMFISVSVQPEIVWEKEDLKDFISLQWTIFSLSVTVFFVWEVIFSRLIKEQKPKKIEDTGLFSEIQFIVEKKNYRENISQKYFLIFCLLLNTIVLASATAYTFIFTIKNSLFSQSLIFTSFYLCINTMLQLLLDVITPMFRAKKEAFSDNKITCQEINKFNKTTDLLFEYGEAIKKIDELPDLNDKKRQELKNNLVSELVKIVQSEPKDQNALTVKKDEACEINDQL